MLPVEDPVGENTTTRPFGSIYPIMQVSRWQLNQPAKKECDLSGGELNSEWVSNNTTVQSIENHLLKQNPYCHGMRGQSNFRPSNPIVILLCNSYQIFSWCISFYNNLFLYVINSVNFEFLKNTNKHNKLAIKCNGILLF